MCLRHEGHSLGQLEIFLDVKVRVAWLVSSQENVCMDTAMKLYLLYGIVCVFISIITSIIFIWKIYASYMLHTLYEYILNYMGCPGGSAVKNLPVMQETLRCRFDPWVKKIPGRKKWQPTVVLPGKFHGGHKESDMTEWLNNNKKHYLTYSLYFYSCHHTSILNNSETL